MEDEAWTQKEGSQGQEETRLSQPLNYDKIPKQKSYSDPSGQCTFM